MKDGTFPSLIAFKGEDGDPFPNLIVLRRDEDNPFLNPMALTRVEGDMFPTRIAFRGDWGGPKRWNEFCLNELFPSLQYSRLMSGSVTHGHRRFLKNMMQRHVELSDYLIHVSWALTYTYLWNRNVWTRKKTNLFFSEFLAQTSKDEIQEKTGKGKLA